MATRTKDALWFLDSRVDIKIGKNNGDGRLSLVEQTSPPRSMPPLHVHPDEDESWIVLEGDATFYVGDAEMAVTPGDAVTAPRNVPHTYRVGGRGARWIVASVDGRFEDFVRAVSRPAEASGLPPLAVPTAAEATALAAVAEEHGIEILGPPGTLPSDL